MKFNRLIFFDTLVYFEIDLQKVILMYFINILTFNFFREAWLNDAVRTELSLNDGFAVNKRRGTAHMFSAQALDKFLKINKLSFAVRAHEVVDCGFKVNIIRMKKIPKKLR